MEVNNLFMTPMLCSDINTVVVASRRHCNFYKIHKIQVYAIEVHDRSAHATQLGPYLEILDMVYFCYNSLSKKPKVSNEISTGACISFSLPMHSKEVVRFQSILNFFRGCPNGNKLAYWFWRHCNLMFKLFFFFFGFFVSFGTIKAIRYTLN